DNTGQPLLAGALCESLEISGFIQPQMLIAVNFGLCATLNDQFIAKAPAKSGCPVLSTGSSSS
ncbi:MAG: hypothetical protein ACKO2Z_22670, partial [Sphaerospermopsis kisseleviana]